MFCSECGSKISDGQQFCPSCGAKAVDVADVQGSNNQNGFWEVDKEMQKTNPNVDYDRIENAQFRGPAKEGLGGALLFYTILQIISIIGALFTLINVVSSSSSDIVGILSFVASPALIALSLFFIFTRKRAGRMYHIVMHGISAALLGVLIVLSILMAVGALSVSSLASGIFASLGIFLSFAFGIAFTAQILWFFYFKKSERVESYFVE